MAGAQFNIATGLNLTHVPYRETGAANNNLMAGRFEVMFQTVAAQLVRGGRMKARAVTRGEGSPAFAELPTLREAGVDLVSVGWFGLFAPHGTPPEWVARPEPENPGRPPRQRRRGARPRRRAASFFAKARGRM